MNRIALLIWGFSIIVNLAFCQERKTEKANTSLEKATAALEDLIEIKEKSIPLSLLKKMEGIVLFPRAIKVALGVGGQGGRGFAIIRKENGGWSNPYFLSMGEGSVGFQIGLQSSDIILIFKRRENIIKLEKTELTLGGDIGIAAGPVGRSASATTDIGFDAEIYSYSRSKGLYAGISLEGTVLESNNKMNDSFYDKEDISLNEIFYKKSFPFNEKVKSFIDVLERASE